MLIDTVDQHRFLLLDSPAIRRLATVENETTTITLEVLISDAHDLDDVLPAELEPGSAPLVLPRTRRSPRS